ncbi:mevalonate kinase [Streptomyces olivaceiscleroticus]|uniref:Mevalonate kinase n=1 Tax=Streptomyces olivaceiscleroticus TaxID=68245 RepID=A0ABP3JSZ2_9ACTN
MSITTDPAGLFATHTCAEITLDILRAVRPQAAVRPCRSCPRWAGDGTPPHYPVEGDPDMGPYTPECTPGPRAVRRAAAPGTHRAGTGRAHGKVILLGEHAAVYGAPAVAVPLPDLQVRAVATPGRRPGRGLQAYGVRFPSPHQDTTAGHPSPSVEGAAEALRALVDAVLQRAESHPVRAVDIQVESNIPTGRGLGASAACARAATHALADLLDLRLSPAEVFDLVQVAETAAHGRASGIDAWATGSASCVLLVHGRVSGVSVGGPAWLVVADSGESGSTRHAVEMLRTAFSRDPMRKQAFLRRSTALTQQALDALAQGESAAAGRFLTECHQLLTSLGLTTARVRHLVEVALHQGALGAKMSGGGLGGCIVALTDSAAGARTLSSRLAARGAEHTWVVALGEGRRR